MVETISQLFLNTVKSYPKDALMLYKKDGEYTPVSTSDFEAGVKELSLGLQSLGLEKGDKLVIFSDNSPFWVMTDLANLCLGGILRVREDQGLTSRHRGNRHRRAHPN